MDKRVGSGQKAVVGFALVFGPRTLVETGAPVQICGTRRRVEGKTCDIPLLAKNERGVGHPAVFAEIELKKSSRVDDNSGQRERYVDAT
jgi:hypothetical protein